MDLTDHSLPNMFRQLGLPSTQAEIDSFIAQHRPVRGEIALADAVFWTPGQAQFLREEIGEDAEWAEIVDQLNVLLRA